MAESQQQWSQSNDGTCVVCFKNVVYYSIGECDHPVCFECSTRMRVLCLQNECPICRKALSRVVFTESVQLYKDLCTKVFTDRLFERQFKIGFCSEEIKGSYEKLLENRCKLCEKLPSFRTFSMLSDHMRKAHERYYCDLCVKHLRIFTSERRCYTRQELAHHRRKGDLDDTSHRGHPLCEFCEERFMDADELYRHLRKEHLYCHLCDADGRNLYYATHDALKHHFRTDHFLCEEGECAANHLTAVFRSEIDLKGHRATVHGRGLNRGASRQARTIELQFNITPHPVAQRTPRDRDRERDRQEAESPPPAPAPPAPRIDTRSNEQFPCLSAAASAPAPGPLLGAPSGKGYRGSDGLARTNKNFPSLGGAGGGPAPPRSTPAPSPRTQPLVSAALLRNSKPSVSIQLNNQATSASNFRLTQTGGARISAARPAPLDDDDFPSLGPAMPRDDHPSIGAGTMQPPKVTMINSQEMQAFKSNQTQSQPKKAHLSSEAFPALSSTAVPSTPPQWITISKSKEKSKPAKPDPPSTPRESTFNPAADFPTLPFNNNKPKSKKNPVQAPIFQSSTKKEKSPPQPPPTKQTDTKASKKEKKKQNIVKTESLEDLPTYVNGLNLNEKKIKEAYEAAMTDSPSVEVDRKIKTIVDTSEKKRNVGNGDFALAAKDYPPLSAKDSAPNKKVTEEPKWLDNRSVKEVKKVNGTAFKVRPSCDGMTFTNSSGQTFPAPVHSYIPPPDFEHRNRELVKKFAVALGGAAAVEDFKVASRAFRDNIISADEFYQHCRTALGSQLESVFPDLVVLLPDIAKQQELVVGRNMEFLTVCQTCGQLVDPGDSIAHDTAHWPPLAPH